MWHRKMRFSSKCNSGRIAIQWFHIKHCLDYQYTKFQPYTFRGQKMCVFARYATLVPRLKGYLIKYFIKKKMTNKNQYPIEYFGLEELNGGIPQTTISMQ